MRGWLTYTPPTRIQGFRVAAPAYSRFPVVFYEVDRRKIRTQAHRPKNTTRSVSPTAYGACTTCNIYIYTPGSTYDGNQGARCSKGVLIINVVSELIKTLVHNIMFVAKEIMALSLTLPLPLPLPSRYRYWYQHRYRYCCRYHYHYYRYHYHYYRYR